MMMMNSAIEPTQHHALFPVKQIRGRMFTFVPHDLRVILIDHFTLVCLVAWTLNESETGVDLVLIETSLLFLC